MKYIVFLALASIALIAGNFTVKSNDIKGQLTKAQEFNGFGCNGQNISPELHWSDAPKGTKSFAITVYDPDAPTGSGWWHWIAVNIPANVSKLPSGASNKSMPKGTIEIANDYDKIGFGGACPPKGDKPHRYIFTIYALDVPRLDIKPDTNNPIAGFMINSHAIAKASLMAYYGR